MRREALQLKCSWKEHYKPEETRFVLVVETGWKRRSRRKSQEGMAFLLRFLKSIQCFSQEEISYS